jgi:peptidoglycan-N-acetylglucosamine deacetylase
MSRFVWTTLLAGAVALGVAGVCGGEARVALLVGVGAAYAGAVGCGVACIRMQFFGPAVCRGRRGDAGRRRVALTFDDGPDPAATPKLLDLLKREGIEAAFFCMGKRVAAHPQLAARIAAEGHVLGNHSYHHRWWSNFMLRAAWRREIGKTQEAIAQAAGVSPGMMRPPMGLTSPSLAAALRQTGLELVGWDVRSLDTICSRTTVLRRIGRGVRDGSIILLHDGGADPEGLTAVVGEVIKDLRGRGYTLERLDRLLER